MYVLGYVCEHNTRHEDNFVGLPPIDDHTVLERRRSLSGLEFQGDQLVTERSQVYLDDPKRFLFAGAHLGPYN